MALVLLLAGRMPNRLEEESPERGGKSRLTVASRHDLDETARRVARLVRELGGSVVATAHGAPGQPEAQRVMVLGDDAGRTPALQAEGEALPVLPWQVWLRQQADGRTEVSLLDPQGLPLPAGVANDWGDRLRRWPELLGQALG
jgi:uncharacterized protein (DUF302 family)